MKNPFLILIFAFTLSILLLADPCLADTVVEGGKYTEEKSQIPFENIGGLAGASLPTEMYYASDKYANAPLDKKLFVVGDDGNCFYANFKIVNGKKTLMVYHESRTFIENCIYQKKLMTDPSGFAIFERGGGICKPVYADSMEALKKNGESALKVVNNTVAIKHCTSQTSSYGLAFRTNQKINIEPKIIEIEEPAPIAKHLEKPVIIVHEKKTAPEKPKPTIETVAASIPKKEKPKKKIEIKIEKKIAKKIKKEPAINNPMVTIKPAEPTKPIENTPPKWQALLNQAKEKLATLTKEEIIVTPPVVEKAKPVVTVKKEKVKKMRPQVKTQPRKVAAVPKTKLPQFTIQVGSFATSKEAETQIQALRKTDSSLEIFSVEARVVDKTWHRVFVGRYSSRAEVKADIDRIRALSSSAAFIQSLKPD